LRSRAFICSKSGIHRRRAIIVYSGAIMVLFVFVIMLLNAERKSAPT